MKNRRTVILDEMTEVRFEKNEKRHQLLNNDKPRKNDMKVVSKHGRRTVKTMPIVPFTKY